MPRERRIVITGLGVISPIGQDVATFGQNLFNGVCGIENVDFAWRDLAARFPVAPVKDFDPSVFIETKKATLLDRFAQFAVAAARQAFEDSGLVLTPKLAERTAVITGTSVGSQNTIEESFLKLANGSSRAHPFTIPRLMSNAGSSHISMTLGLTGPAFTVASACASAVHAMGVTIQMLRSGLVDQAITGGAEACLTFGTLKGWEALRILSPDVCRPFSADRGGLVLGEGAAMLMLETLEAAQARGARIYAELAGFGMSSDAKDITTPDVGGAARAIAGALADAGLEPQDIDYINAHGTGTRVNDIMETEAIKQVFGDRARHLAVSSSKSMFGHALGAAGGLEMVATVLAVLRDMAPPTINSLGPDPECDLDYVPNVARPMSIRAALNDSFGFGGLNAVVAVRKMS
jgi:nodulation protein E